MLTFYINDLIQFYCHRYVSNIQVFILRKTCICNLMVFLSCTNIGSVVAGRMCFVMKKLCILLVLTTCAETVVI